MKRNRFITSMLALAAAPFVSYAKITGKRRAGKGFKVSASKDRFNTPLTLMEGDTFYTKISSSDSDGDIFLFESTRVVNGGPPLHFHYDQDEWFYILSGEFIFKIGDETFTAKAGDSFYGPRMIPHAFAKTGAGEARMLISYQPAGKMEEHFKAVSAGLYKNMSEQEKQEMRKKHGFEVVGPALAHEK